jgi:hypothetical protein
LQKKLKNNKKYQRSAGGKNAKQGVSEGNIFCLKIPFLFLGRTIFLLLLREAIQAALGWFVYLFIYLRANSERKAKRSFFARIYIYLNIYTGVAKN